MRRYRMLGSGRARSVIRNALAVNISRRRTSVGVENTRMQLRLRAFRKAYGATGRLGFAIAAAGNALTVTFPFTVSSGSLRDAPWVYQSLITFHLSLLGSQLLAPLPLRDLLFSIRTAIPLYGFRAVSG